MRRSISAGIIAAALMGPLAVNAVTVGPAFAQSGPREDALDTLFGRLRVAPDAATARTLTNEIWLIWTTPTDAALAARMAEVMAMRQNADFTAVMTLLDGIVTDFPDYAEGWNQRATINYLLSNYEQSLEDIDKVLALEPRHFGALVGRAVIYRNQGKLDLALKDMVAALAIHPFLVERALFPELESFKSI